MKKAKIWLLLLLIIPCMFMLTACSFVFNETEDTTYVVSIEKSTSTETTDTYLVTYSDDTTTLITIENGKDGLDGQDLTLEELKKYCIEKGISLDDFIADHITIEYSPNIATVSSATAKALKSTVSIWCEFPTTDNTMLGSGAGVIYKMESQYSYIITNYHVVYYNYSITTDKIANKITMFTYGSQEAVGSKKDAFGNVTAAYGYGAIDCTFVGGAMNYDIAILKVKTSDILKYQPAACAVTIATSYQVGNTAIAIGNPTTLSDDPNNRGTNVSSGIVSKYSEEIEMTDLDGSSTLTLRVMRIDTPVNSGNSGGGLFDINGNLLGIVNAKISSTEIENIAYALPFDNVTKVADNVIYYHSLSGSTAQVKKLLLGTSFTVTNYRSEFIETSEGTKIVLRDDIVILSTNENSVAYKMDLQEGDIITGATIVRGTDQYNYTFKQSHELTDLLLSIRTGDILVLKLKRGNVEISTTTQTITENMFTIIK